MIGPTPLSPDIPDPVMVADSELALESHALARLELFANARGVSSTVALHQLLDAGTLLLEREDAQASRSLSKKQVAVLESLQAGHSVKEIAGQLGVSEGTVRTHIRRILHHRDCSNLLSLRFH